MAKEIPMFFRRDPKYPDVFHESQKIPFGQNFRPKNILQNPVIKICQWGPLAHCRRCVEALISCIQVCYHGTKLLSDKTPFNIEQLRKTEGNASFLWLNHSAEGLLCQNQALKIFLAVDIIMFHQNGACLSYMVLAGKCRKETRLFPLCS